MRFGLRTLLVILALAPMVIGGLLGAFREGSLEVIETRSLILTVVLAWSIVALIVGAWWWGAREQR